MIIIFFELFEKILKILHFAKKCIFVSNSTKMD